MKAKYQLEKGKRGYVIASINDHTVRVATQLLASKLMRKCHADDVQAPVIALVEQCAEGVYFSWAQFLCDEFLTNCQEAQGKGKTFHYTWFLLSILLAARELPQGSQFLTFKDNLPEAVWYTSL